MALFLIFLLIALHHEGNCINIPSGWKAYLLQLTESDHRLALQQPFIIPPLLPESYDETLDLSSFVLPYVMLWDPLRQLKSLIFTNPQTCLVENCESTLQFQCWRTGTSEGKQPRIIHSSENIVLLVSAMYSCDNGHIILGTDARMIKIIPPQFVPFILLYRTGFTKQFISTAIHLVGEGQSIHSVIRYITAQRKDNLIAIIQRIQYFIHAKSPCSTITTEDLAGSEVIKLLRNPIPSNDVLSKCFLAHFKENKDFYFASMQAIKIKDFISFDHTFKVATNIGFLRPDGKWVKQYSAVFIAMNELGKVVTWQFTKGTSLDEVTNALDSLKNRIEISSDNHLLVLTDNCCKDRRKVADIFGDEVNVKLDLFHAVQRVLKVVAKRHPSFYSFKEDFKLVFRDFHDIGRERKSATPDIETLISNLDEFMKKWSKCGANGIKIVTEQVQKEILSLRRHINKGCLSDIRVGQGTNRNENLHRMINLHFSHNRLGVPLALALLTILLHKHNCKTEDKQVLTMPKLSPMQEPRATFGILPKEEATETDWLSLSTARTCDFSEIDVENSQYKIILDEKVSEYVSLDTGLKILRKAMLITEIANAMKKCSLKSPLFNFYMIPFMSPIISLFFHNQKDPPDPPEAENRLLKRNSAIHSFGLKVIPICGDGNCCFSSVAFSLITMKDVLLQHSENFFTNHGLTFSDDMQNLAYQLRVIAVREWKNNASFYESFLVDVDVNSEADTFLQSSIFDGSLGDSMIVALSNALELPFVVFTTLYYHPILTQVPRNQAVPFPIFLAHTHLGVGHYDALAFAENTSASKLHSKHLPSVSTSDSSCTCGKNDKLNKEHCITATSKYGTIIIKCPCLSSGNGCSDQCKCKNCNNPKGNSTNSLGQPKRKRHKHDWQVTAPKSADFMMMIQEKVTSGSVTMLEYFVLEYIIQYCSQEQLAITTEAVSIIYDAISSISSCVNNESDLPLGSKSEEQITSFLKLHQKNLEEFQRMSIYQLCDCHDI